MNIPNEFDNLFTIMSHPRFLKMEGLGNEVPFFVHAYDIRKQANIYSNLNMIRSRLKVDSGIQTRLIGLYDMVLDIIGETSSLEKEATRNQIGEILRFAIEGRKRVKAEIYKLDSTFDPVCFRCKDLESGEVFEVRTPEEVRYPHYFKRFDEDAAVTDSIPESVPAAAAVTGTAQAPAHAAPESTMAPSLPSPDHISIQENQSGVSYRKLFGAHIAGAKRIELQDPYIRKVYQIQNLIEFIRVIIANKEEGEDVAFHLVTGSGETKLSEIESHFRELHDGLMSLDIRFTHEFNETIHDRFIKTDTGWIITPGRGLDMFQHFSRSSYSLEQVSQEARLCKAFEVTCLKQ